MRNLFTRLWYFKVNPFVLQIDFMLQIRLDKFPHLQNIYPCCTQCALSSKSIDETSWPSVSAALHNLTIVVEQQMNALLFSNLSIATNCV